MLDVDVEVLIGYGFTMVRRGSVEQAFCDVVKGFKGDVSHLPSQFLLSC